MMQIFDNIYAKVHLFWTLAYIINDFSWIGILMSIITLMHFIFDRNDYVSIGVAGTIVISLVLHQFKKTNHFFNHLGVLLGGLLIQWYGLGKYEELVLWLILSFILYNLAIISNGDVQKINRIMFSYFVFFLFFYPTRSYFDHGMKHFGFFMIHLYFFHSLRMISEYTQMDKYLMIGLLVLFSFGTLMQTMCDDCNKTHFYECNINLAQITVYLSLSHFAKNKMVFWHPISSAIGNTILLVYDGESQYLDPFNLTFNSKIYQFFITILGLYVGVYGILSENNSLCMNLLSACIFLIAPLIMI